MTCSLNSPSDTLVMDTAKLQVWRQDGDYAYAREIVPYRRSVMEWLQGKIADIWHDIFDSDFYEQNGTTLWIILGAVLLLALIAFIVFKRPDLFTHSGKTDSVGYTVSEDTIYGIDFEQEIAKTMEGKLYREALRLIYLQTLKSLSDNHQIDWQPFKTPTQYTYEYRNPDFRKMTQLFIRVRYGNFEATEEMVKEMRMYQSRKEVHDESND